MVFKGVLWTGVITCCVLYCLVFVAVLYEMNTETIMQTRVRLGLLMFVVPGAVAAMTSREAPLTVALSGALLATPFVMLMLHCSLAEHNSPLQELAFITSAVFWCGSGALVVMLLRTILGKGKPL